MFEAKINNACIFLINFQLGYTEDNFAHQLSTTCFMGMM